MFNARIDTGRASEVDLDLLPFQCVCLGFSKPRFLELSFKNRPNISLFFRAFDVQFWNESCS